MNQILSCPLQLFLSSQLLLSYASGDVFFHEQSHVTLVPDSSGQKTFGFSLAYQNGKHNLVTGAPHSSQTGKVFNCPLDAVLENKRIQCTEAAIDVDALAPYPHEYAPSVKLNLGYSVAANDDYFFTCAPLWIGKIQINKNEYTNRSVGTCFVHNGTAHRYKNFIEINGDREIAPGRILDGNGWRTLIDDRWLLIAKVAGGADVAYVSAQNALADVKSLMDPMSAMRKRHAEHLISYRNVGFSIAAGKFFSANTIYAISGLNDNTGRGAIHFITHRSGEPYLYYFRSKFVMINETGSPGSMFGAAMSSAHLNSDEREELVVGAPAWMDNSEGGYETGAVHIYLGGARFMDKDDVRRRQRVILGNKDGSRFGSAIATSDLDGDYLSELFVSAPYENSGEGALYIFSGYEINKQLMMNTDNFKKISVSQLTRTQVIRNDQFKSFGYSLQVMPDINENGCDELAVGSPNSEKILILKCLPAVNVSIEAEYIGDQLKLTDESFIINVCVSVQDLKNRSLILPLTLRNEVEGHEVYIPNDMSTVNIENIFQKDKEKKYCTNITVKLNDNEAGEYVFRTSIEMDEKRIIDSDDFNNTWALMSPYSVSKAKRSVSRRCKGDDCDPNFEMDFSWSDSTITNGAYDLGSSKSLVGMLGITNVGNTAWEACAQIRVTGAPVEQVGCVENYGVYTCYLTRGLKRTAKQTINIKLNMSQPTNVYDEIKVDVHLFDFCNKPKKNISEEYKLKLNLNLQGLFVTGISRDQNITDTKIQDKKDSTNFKDAHEYWIENKGNISWISVNAKILIMKNAFINSSRVMDWPFEEFADWTEFSQNFHLPPESKQKFIASVDIMKDKIMDNLVDNTLTVKSGLVLNFGVSQPIEKNLSSTVTFRKELHFAQNKNLIILLGVVGGLIALAVLIFILYKWKFFTSPKKKELENLQEQVKVRRESIATQRRESIASQRRESNASQGIALRNNSVATQPVLSTFNEEIELEGRSELPEIDSVEDEDLFV